MTQSRTAIALTIAGSDSSGGAGIQADLKTFSALGVYGASAITALTAQNTRGVEDVMVVPPEFVLAQMRSVASDLKVGAIKIGMLATAPIIEAVADGLDDFPGVPVVLDPVMVATSGDRLLDEDAVEVLRGRLMPRATLVTPNLREGAVLLGEPAESREQMLEGRAERLRDLGAKAVLLTGGESIAETALDIFVGENGVQRIEAPRVETENTHGTGCTLSSAIAAELAKGESLDKAVKIAKLYVTAAIIAADDAVRDAKGRHLDFVRPFLVVEGEALARPGAAREAPAGKFLVVRAVHARRPLSRRVGVAERLARVMERLGMHVLVIQAQLRVVAQRGVLRLVRQALAHPLEHVGQVAAGRLASGQRQAPARVVRHCGRIVERVRAVENRVDRRAALGHAQAPALLEPADVPDLPQRRIDDGEHRSEQPLAFEVLRHAQRARARLEQLAFEGSRIDGHRVLV